MQTTELKKVKEFELLAKGPFNFKYTVYKPSHFPTKLEFYDEDADDFYRTLRLGRSKLVGLIMKDLKKQGKGDGIFVEVYGNTRFDDTEISKIKEWLRFSYGLDENLLDFYNQVSNDSRLEEPIKELYGMKNSCAETLFEILNISSILQNTTVKRSQQMMENMLSNFGASVNYAGKNLYVFYTPDLILESSETQLRELKLGYRAKFLMEIAKYFDENPNVDEVLKSKEWGDAKEELMKIKGVGPYSASLALFAYFKKPNLINYDVWNRKILSEFLFEKERVDKKELEKECDTRWGEYKGYAALYVIENLFVKDPSLQYWRENK